MATEVRSEVTKFDGVDPILGELKRHGTARLRFSPAMIEYLSQLSNQFETPVAELLTQSVGLFLFVVEAQSRGERVCLLDDDDEIVREIVGFGESAGIGAVPSSDSAEEDQADS